MIAHRKPEPVSMEELQWSIGEAGIDTGLAHVTHNGSLIAISQYCKVYVLAGHDQLTKLYEEGARTAPVIYIDQDMLDIARMDD
jgi:hypothetical protein